MVFKDKFWEEKVIKPCNWKIKHYYMKLFFVALVFERIALFLKDDQGMSHEAGDNVADLLLKVNSNFTVPCLCNDFKWKSFHQNSKDGLPGRQAREGRPAVDRHEERPREGRRRQVGPLRLRVREKVGGGGGVDHGHHCCYYFYKTHKNVISHYKRS